MMEMAEVAPVVPKGAVDVREFARIVGRPFTTCYRWARKGWIAATTVKRGERQEQYYIAPAEIRRVKRLLAAGGSVVPAELASV